MGVSKGEGREGLESEGRGGGGLRSMRGRA